MLKRRLILILGMIFILTSLTFISGCKDKIEEPLSTDEIDNNNESDSQEIENVKMDEEEPEEARYISQLKLAYEGRMDKTKPIIGQNVEQYLDDSFEMYYFLGGLASFISTNAIINF